MSAARCGAAAAALVLAVAACGEAQVPPRQPSALDRLRTDWAQLQHYAQANAELPPPAPGERRVVFMGNSITEGWAPLFPALFPGKPYVGRGISGQTSPQMLVRFRQDVIALKPAVVVINAGTNDIAGNTGTATDEMIAGNIQSMAELARANGIRVVLTSILPASRFRWAPDVEPAPRIIALNRWIREYAQRIGAPYVDYHAALADSAGGLPAKYAADGVHPNEAAYRIMAKLVERGISEALR